ncbi:DUF7344 domain-containing protein [Halosimplex sp. J119]
MGETFSFDDAADVLAAAPRRGLLLDLLKRDPQTQPSIDSTDPENDTERAVALYHVHLPKLASYGLIDWDRESGSVKQGENFSEIRPLLEELDDDVNGLPADW